VHRGPVRWTGHDGRARVTVVLIEVGETFPFGPPTVRLDAPQIGHDASTAWARERSRSSTPADRCWPAPVVAQAIAGRCRGRGASWPIGAGAQGTGLIVMLGLTNVAIFLINMVKTSNTVKSAKEQLVHVTERACSTPGGIRSGDDGGAPRATQYAGPRSRPQIGAARTCYPGLTLPGASSQGLEIAAGVRSGERTATSCRPVAGRERRTGP
jgi:hypothetical protein